MTTIQLIERLHSRLTVVSAEITRLDATKRPDQQQFFTNHGKISALQAEQLFLAGLIAELEASEGRP